MHYACKLLIYLDPTGKTLRTPAGLWGTAVVLPMILAYTAWSYRVFRGKVSADGYHA
jgi:cytochrome bd-type quinol oxidase subunit 2